MRAGIPVAVFCLSACIAQAASPPPAQAYGRLPAIGSAALSPDGKRVVLSVGYAYDPTAADGELTALNVIELDTGKVEMTLASPPKNTLRGVGWADDRRPYYYLSVTGRLRDLVPSSVPMMASGPRIEFYRTGVISLDTGKATQMSLNDGARGNSALANLLAPIEGDPGYGRMIAYGGTGTLNSLPKLAVFRVNLETGVGQAKEVGNAQTRGYLLDERGEPVARVDINENKDRWRVFTYEDGKNRVILEQVSEMGQPLSMLGLLEDGRIAAINPHEEGRRDSLLAIDRKTGATSPLEGVPDTEGSDIGPINDPWKRRVVGVRWTADLPRQKFFDVELAKIAADVQAPFENGYVMLQSWSRDRSRVLLFGERPDDAGAYYVYDVATKKLRFLGKRYPEIRSADDLGERLSIKYRARDGTLIPAYLTLPAGVEPRNLPLVLLVHAGRTRATTSRSTGGRASSPRAATRCCSLTTEGLRATATTGSTRAAAAGATASCRPTWKTAWSRS